MRWLSSLVKSVSQFLLRIRRSRRLRQSFFILGLVGGGILLVLISFGVYYRNRVFPGISVGGVSVSSQLIEDLKPLLTRSAEEIISTPITLFYDGEEWTIHPKDIDLDYEIRLAETQASTLGRNSIRSGIPLLLKSLTSGVSLPMPYTINVDVLEASLSAIATDFDIPTIPPSLEILQTPDEDNSRVAVHEGEKGRRIDLDSARKILLQQFSIFSSEPIILMLADEPDTFNHYDPELTKLRADHLLDKRMVLSYDDNSTQQNSEWELAGENLIEFLDFDGTFNEEKIASYSSTLAQSIDRDPQDATFLYKDGRVTEFAPAKDGLKLDIEKTTQELVTAFAQLEHSSEEYYSVALQPQTQPPEITIEDVNSLGIKELLGRGESTFHGSIINREHNIALSSSRMSGVLVPPEEIFSYNASVGDISGATGYRQSYIIKDGRTVLDDGGGVCQSSTTLFRAALDAGLPIVQRHPHSYRVTYYEQNSKPGFDATVFAPSVDLKFKNDTPRHILVQTAADLVANTLVVEIYGTKDGRESTIANHRIWDVTPPPPDLYEDDPTLSSGQFKQVDWKAWGAKVKFDYSVTRNGETLFEKTFYSNYQPWQSVFLRGTGPI